MVGLNDNRPKKYKSIYTENPRAIEMDGPLVLFEEVAQKAIAENPIWHVAKKINSTPKGYQRGVDSKVELEKLGFRILNNSKPVDDLFYEVEPPKDWDKITNGYWTYFRDENGRNRISQFFKGAFYDRDSFVNIELPNRHYDLRTRIDNKDFVKKYSEWQQKLFDRFKIKKRDIEKFIDETVKEKLFRELSYKVRDKLHGYVGINNKEHDSCNLFERFIWHYFYPIFEATEQGALLSTDIPAAIINGFEGKVPYPFALVESYAPSFRQVKNKKRELKDLQNIAQEAIDKHLVSLSDGIKESTYFEQTQTLLSGLMISSSTAIDGILAIENNKGLIVNMNSEDENNFRISLRCGKDKHLEEQLNDMTFVEKSIESGFNIL